MPQGPPCFGWAAVLLLTARHTAAAADTGYEMLYKDSTDEVSWQCWDAPGLPAWVNGSFILPAAAQFSLGGEEFVGAMDGFGKLHRFELRGGEHRVCLKARMMLTGFYNDSVAVGRVAASMLFAETVPPRACSKVPMACSLGANDNVFVNAIQSGPKFLQLTDSTTALELEPRSLTILGKVNFTKTAGHGAMHLGVLGSAHPVRFPAGPRKGQWAALQIWVPVVPGAGSFVDVVALPAPGAAADFSNGVPRELVHASKRVAHTPYFHSYGVTESYVVLPYTPLAYNMAATMEGKPMMESFAQLTPLATQFHLIPVGGGEEVVVDAPHAFTYDHVINCFDNDSGIVLDVTGYRNATLWILNAQTMRPAMMNKTARDAIRDQYRSQAWRYVVHLHGPLAGTVTSEELSSAERLTGYPKINMRRMGLPYCVYYANEWFHNGDDMASMAVVRHDTCTGEKRWWHRPSHYPSEPFFIERPGATAEDDGLLAFGVTDGTTGSGYLEVVDARTMQTTAVEQTVPMHFTFTTHGEYFDGMLS